MEADFRFRYRGTSICALGAVVFVLSNMAWAQNSPPSGPLNPPALPALPLPGPFGATLASPNIGLSFPNPNNATWTPLGPAPLGSASGRITGVAVDPTNSNVIYIAAAGGGVWKSTDGGASYNPLTDSQASLATGSIAIAPSNPNHLYVGTGEDNNSADSNFGAGILVSTNGGSTWSLYTGPGGVFSRRAVGKISVDPTNENIAYASVNDYNANGLCCSNTGIFKTTDGGANWTNVTSAAGLDSTRPWSDVVVDPNSPTIIYAAHGDVFAATTNGVYRSLDSGSTWALLANAPNGTGFGRVALAVARSASTSGSHKLYVAMTTTCCPSNLYQMLVSNNADATTPTFTNLTATPNFGGSGGQGWYDWVIGVDPTNANNVYGAGALNYNTNTNHVVRSINGGTTWTDITTVSGIQPHTDSHAMGFDSSGRLALGNDGGIWRFDPAVPSWTNLNANLNTIQFTGIGLHPTSNQTVIGGSQDNGTELTTGSLNWSAVDGGDGGFSQFSQTSPSVVYSNHPIGSFGVANFFRVSTNGGATWVSRTPTIANSNLFNFYAPIFVDPSNGSRVFLGGDGLYESTDAGVNWTKHTSPSSTAAIDAIAVLPGGNVIYVATGGAFATTSQLWVSINDGTSWTQRNLPAGTGRVNEIDIDPNDTTGNTAVAVINTFGGANGQIYRTINGGTNWTNVSGNAPAIPTWSAKIDTNASKTIYVSNETGVYSSTSPYAAWSAVGTGLPHAQGVDLELNTSLHVLAVGTHGRGAWNFSTTAPPPPTLNAVSVTPNSGSGAGPQQFTAVYSDSNGTSDLQVVYLDFGSVGFAPNNCIAVYVPGANQLSLFTDNNGGGTTPITLGGGGSTSNSQCTLFGGTAPATVSGNNLTVPFLIQFKTGYLGKKHIFGLAQSIGGTQSGGGVPADLGTWTPGASTPGVTSVTPSSGSGTGSPTPVVFSAVFSDSGGANDLQAVYLQFASVGDAPHNCKVAYVPGPNQLYLFTDDGLGALGPIAEGAGGGSLSNSQCTLTSGTTAATLSGNNLTVPINLTFLSGYGGKKTIFGLAQTYAGTQSNAGALSTLGTWTPFVSAPSVTSVTPNSGSGFGSAGSPLVFNAVYSDNGGATDLQAVYLTFGSVLNGANSCAVGYIPGVNQLFLFNDAGNGAATIGLGGGGSISNSQCTLYGGGSGATLSGGANPLNLTVPFSIVFNGAFTGTKNAIGYAQNYAGASAGPTVIGTWIP